MQVFPELIFDERLIAAADVVRVVNVVLAAALLGFCLRASRRLHSVPGGYPGMRPRLVALGIAAVVAAGTEYDRIGEPVTLRIALNCAFLILAVYSLVRAPSRLPVQHEARLNAPERRR